MEEIVVGIDVGTTKVCTLVGRVERTSPFASWVWVSSLRRASAKV